MEQMAPDFDPHLDLAVAAKAVTPDQAAQYKAGIKEIIKLIKPIRHIYKTVNYACVYGAGGPRVAIAAGVSHTKGNQLVETYWKRNWAVKKVAENCKVKVVRGDKWLYNPVSGFWYSLRSEKDRFSTLCQGTGVYCFDTWVKNFRRRRPQLTAQFHDEVVLCHKKGIRERVVKLLQEAIHETNLELNLTRELGIDTQFGDTYASIH
jgi:DNA polymerase I-like protein with 3'-5' exonuclease and polymerase domains